MTALLFLAAGIAIAVLGRSLIKRMASDRLGAFSTRRRGSSLLVGRGKLVDGNRHLDVALALTETLFIYESPQLEGSLERSTIHEVEYENELSTGQSVREGKVLRLRCFSTSFEFVIPTDSVMQWKANLPPHRIETQTSIVA
ncbi:MAG TPA: hypothetical protein VFT12_12645 [Thermoanaerobaculia bacterium]|nr:hypothetical protein [Thermoanaerobaculia bacterium]